MSSASSTASQTSKSSNQSGSTGSSSRFGSRFGSNNNNSSSSNQSSSSGSRFSGFSRFGRQGVNWTVEPRHEVAVRISLEGLGDPFHRLLGKSINPDYSDVDTLLAALHSDDVSREELVAVLDTAWGTYGFEGAAMLYPWNSEIYTAYTHPIYPLASTEGESEEEETPSAEDSYNSPYTCLRAIDIAVVLNLLGRVRANVVVANTPVALEPAFLKQTLLCDDPRVVAIVRATGCMEEQW